MIKECGDMWCLYSKDGEKVLGRHKTRQGAVEQEQAIMKSEGFSIKDREIFSTGVHNGDKYTDEDLQEMEKAFNALDFKPAIKLGHSKEIGAPAYGYLDNVRKVGGKLLADLVNLPKEVYEAVQQKRYGRVSAEVFWNLSRNGKKYKRAIGALALLGQEIPGVAGLKPLYEFSMDDDFEHQVNYEFDNIEPVAHNMSENNAGNGQTQGVTKMSDDNLKEYQEKIDALQDQIKALETANSDVENKYANDLKSSNEKLEALQDKLADKEAKEFSEGMKIPALRPALKALYKHALDNADATVKVYSTETKKDEDLNLIDTLQTIVDYVNDQAESLFKEYAVTNNERSDGIEDPAAELDAKTKEYMEKNKTDDYSAAMRSVLADNPELDKAYNAI